MEGLVVGGSALVNVDDHGRSSPAAEKSLEEFGQLALSEGDVGALRPDGGEFGPLRTVKPGSDYNDESSNGGSTGPSGRGEGP